MNKLKEFIEKNGKIIEFIFSLISLIIVGVVGTTISINNSLTSTAQLELARANAQPVFSIKTEYNYSDTENTERLIINVDGGFAENLNITEYTWLECFKNSDRENTLRKCLLTDYFITSYYSGNNRGDIINLTNSDNLTKYATLLKDIFDPNAKYTHILKYTLLAISYEDITGKKSVKYYETNGQLYNHITEDKAMERINELKNLPSILLEDLNIDILNNL